MPSRVSFTRPPVTPATITPLTHLPAGQNEVVFTIANGVNVTLSELFGALEELAETRAELAATKIQLRGTEDS